VWMLNQISFPVLTNYNPTSVQFRSHKSKLKMRYLNTCAGYPVAHDVHLLGVSWPGDHNQQKTPFDSGPGDVHGVQDLFCFIPFYLVEQCSIKRGRIRNWDVHIITFLGVRMLDCIRLIIKSALVNIYPPGSTWCAPVRCVEYCADICRRTPFD